MNLPASSDLTKENKSFFAQDILQLEVDVRTHAILMKFEQRSIRLFGRSQNNSHLQKFNNLNQFIA